MSLKLKTLGLGLLALLATSAFTVMSASASNSGHFGSEVTHTTIKGTEGPGVAHRLHFVSHGLEGEIGCESATYEGTASVNPVKEIQVKPSYSGCKTTGSSTVTVTPNGCEYKFAVASGGTNGTASLVCPAGKAVEIHHDNCTITVPQVATNEKLTGIHYTTITEATPQGNKHALTIDVAVKFTVTYHGGICIFLGTDHHTGTLNGSVTVRGFDTVGNQVGITAT